MTEHPASFAEPLQRKILPNVQRLALLISIAGFAFVNLQYPGGHQLLIMGLSALAMAFILMAFLPLPIPVGCTPDLYATITYKIIYIGCSVMSIGVLFQFLNLQGEMLLIGSVTSGAALLGAGGLVARKKDNWIILKVAILRGATFLLLSVYLMRIASII